MSIHAALNPLYLARAVIYDLIDSLMYILNTGNRLVDLLEDLFGVFHLGAGHIERFAHAAQ